MTNSEIRMGWGWRLAGIALALVTAGCSSSASSIEDCESVEEYQASQSAGRLAVPAGLDTPDTSGRLEVPEGPVSAEPLARNAGCLQRPPNYFDRPLTAPGD